VSGRDGPEISSRGKVRRAHTADCILHTAHCTLRTADCDRCSVVFYLFEARAELVARDAAAVRPHSTVPQSVARGALQLSVSESPVGHSSLGPAQLGAENPSRWRGASLRAGSGGPVCSARNAAATGDPWDAPRATRPAGIRPLLACKHAPPPQSSPGDAPHTPAQTGSTLGAVHLGLLICAPDWPPVRGRLGLPVLFAGDGDYLHFFASALEAAGEREQWCAPWRWVQMGQMRASRSRFGRSSAGRCGPVGGAPKRPRINIDTGPLGGRP